MGPSGPKYIRTLIAGGENQELDFKFEISDARKIARTLSAFSNTDGGRLLIGVKDNGRISGVRSEEEFYMVESAASLYSKPEVPFQSRHHLVDGKAVLEIYIPASDNKPVYARDDDDRWKAYIRVADQNMLASVVQLQVWKEEKKSRGRLLEFTRREEILLKTLAANPGATLSRLQRDSGFPRKELVALMTKLVLFDVVRMYVKDDQNRFWLNEKPGE